MVHCRFDILTMLSKKTARYRDKAKPLVMESQRLCCE
jgi:hypothetical protein